MSNISTENIIPSVELSKVNLTGTITNIQDDPESPDGNWYTVTNTNSNSNVSLRFQFNNSTFRLNTQANAQQMKVLIRKAPSADGNEVTLDLDLYQAGTFLGSILSGHIVTSNTGEIITADWSASSLSLISPFTQNVQLEIRQRTGAANDPRRYVEIGAARWIASTLKPQAVLTT